MKTLSFIFFSFILFNFSYGQDGKYQALLINENLKKLANSSIRYHSTHISIESTDQILIEYKQIITVFNKNGDKDIDAFLYYDDNIKVKNLEATIFDAVGNEIKKIKERDFRDYSAVDGGTLYSDSRVYVLDYTPINYPYTVEFVYTIKSSNTAFIRSWFPLRNYNQSVEYSEFSIENKTGTALRHKTYNLDFFKDVSVQDSGNLITCKANNLSALKREDYSPSLSSFVPKVSFSLSQFTYEGVEGYATNWQEMGKWQYEKLIKGRDEVSEKTKQEIIDLTQEIDDPIEKVKLVYKYVQDRTRYISVQVGIGGWQPIDAETVDNVKYGDCKGLTNYTKALLKIAGINAKYSVVFAGSEKRDLDKDFASMQGNHVILNIPTQDQDLWLECTSQDIPFGFLGSFTDDRKVLVIDETGGQIKTTDSYIEKDNSQYINATIKLNTSGNIDVDFKVKSTGTQFYNKYYLAAKNDKEVKKYYKNYYDHLKGLKIKSYTFFNDEDNVEFTEEINIEAENFTSKFGNRFMFNPNVLNQSISTPDKYEKRMTPFQISRGFYDDDHFVFSLPQGMQVESMPKSINIETKFGDYKAEVLQNENGSIIYNRQLLIKHGEFSKEEYSDYRNFMKEVNKADNTKIILIQKT